jgi:hypothetical protein
MSMCTKLLLNLKVGKKCLSTLSQLSVVLSLTWKKFYNETNIAVEHQKYFGFMYKIEENENHTVCILFVLRFPMVIYTRAPYIARQIMKP